ncbi:MAG: tRNA methyltransferase [Fimbriimonadaceae bacterium]|nr:tRNA methyltransferase [Fimbriimonadaceae bacterium]
MEGRQVRKKAAIRKVFRGGPASQAEISFLLQDFEDAYNVGSIFRVADAVGAKLIVGTGRTPLPPDPMIGVTSLGHHRRIPFRHVAGHEEAGTALREEGWTLVAVEVADGAIPYLEYEFPERVCLVLGNEGAGVYGSLLRQCAAAVYVPMFGKGRSMNVAMCAGIVAYRAILKKSS